MGRARAQVPSRRPAAAQRGRIDRARRALTKAEESARRAAANPEAWYDSPRPRRTRRSLNGPRLDLSEGVDPDYPEAEWKR